MDAFSDLDAAALLAAEETGLRQRRQAEVDSLHRLLAWCDLNSIDPQTEPGATPIRFGGNRLTRLGGPGTPEVAELSLSEFAIAAHTGTIATANKAADALDLRHRLPHLWAHVQNLHIEVWLARKIASLSRKLTKDTVGIVDTAVANAIASTDLAPGKLLELAEARIIEADPEAHRARIAAEEARTGVWARRRRPGQGVDTINTQADVQPITIRLGNAGAVEFTTTIDEIAHILADQHTPTDEDDVPTMDQWRARAVELLADPYATVRLLDGLNNSPSDPEPSEVEEVAQQPSRDPGTDETDVPTEAPEPAPDPAPEPAPEPKKPARTPRQAVIHVHLCEAVLAGHANGHVDGVARVEGLGPLLLEQLAALLRHRHITVKPVIDLHRTGAVDSYEHPTACKERTLLRTGGDVFPHTTSRTRRLDHDHPIPYDKHGPPGQTGDHNDAPLTRRHHRAKTHLPYQVKQLGLGTYRWHTPNGLVRIVTPNGTRTVQPLHAPDGTLAGEIYPARFQLVLDLAA